MVLPAVLIRNGETASGDEMEVLLAISSDEAPCWGNTASLKKL